MLLLLKLLLQRRRLKLLLLPPPLWQQSQVLVLAPRRPVLLQPLLQTAQVGVDWWVLIYTFQGMLAQCGLYVVLLAAYCCCCLTSFHAKSNFLHCRVHNLSHNM
jgi:hypothetical protein